MSMVVMRRKLQAKGKFDARRKAFTQTSNFSKGGFSLMDTNTGSLLMGRTYNKAGVIPPRLRSHLNRRVDCCKNISASVVKKSCVPDVSIKKVPVQQTSFRNRHRFTIAIKFTIPELKFY